MPEHTTGKPRDFEPLPPGEHGGHVGEIRVRYRDDGNEAWDVPFIVDGDEYAGRMLWDTLIFGLEQCGWKIDQFVAATKGPQEEGTKLKMEARDFEELPCRVRVFTDTYQGEARSKIKTWIAIKPEENEQPAQPAPKGETKQPAGTSEKKDRF